VVWCGVVRFARDVQCNEINPDCESSYHFLKSATFAMNSSVTGYVLNSLFRASLRANLSK
jgi:hypothetical protein